MAFAASTPQSPENILAGKPVGSPSSNTAPLRQPARPRQAQNQAQQQYQRAQIETASPTRLVVLLFDGAIRFCSMGLDAMKSKDLEAQNTNLIRAQRILAELMSSLDRKAGGDVAENLFQLYRFSMDKLVQANLHDQRKPVEEVLTILGELRETWQEIDRMTMQGNSSAEAAPPTASAGNPSATPGRTPAQGPAAPPAAGPAKPARAMQAAQAMAAQAAQQKAAKDALPRPALRLGDQNA